MIPPIHRKDVKMGEPTEYKFDLREVVEALIKRQGIHNGLWGVTVEFALAAAYIPAEGDSKSLTPAGISLVERIGIRKVDEANSLTVDAALVNPEPRAMKRKPRRG